MPWWGWILVGAILLGSELFVTTEFYLVVFGVAAMVTGLLAVALDLSVTAQWSVFAVVAVVFLVFFRARIWKRIQGPDAERPRDRVVGELATVSERIEPGASGSATLRGSVWTVRNVGDAPLLPGDRARALEMDGLTIEVRGGDAPPSEETAWKP